MRVTITKKGPHNVTYVYFIYILYIYKYMRGIYMPYPWIRVAYMAMALVTNTPVLALRSARCPVTLQTASSNTTWL